MSFGSWIAGAAEAHRNRMFQGSEGDKNRAMQKYGIDQNTLLRNEIMKYDFDRTKKSQETLDKNYLKILENQDQENIHEKHIEGIKKLQESTRPSLWEAFTGQTTADGSNSLTRYLNGLNQWLDGSNERIYESWGMLPSAEEIAGPATYEDFKPQDFKGMTVEDMLRLKAFLNSDPGAVGNASTQQIQTQLKTLLDTANGGIK